MKSIFRLMQPLSGSFTLSLAALLFAGCRTAPAPASAGGASTAVSPASAAVAQPAPTPKFLPVRIKAGSAAAFTDAEGKAWLAEQGFADGDTTARPDLKIANTKTPGIYLSERYSMTAFSYPVPNGKYTVKLHFCETFEGIEGPGQRVFSFNVEGHAFKDFDIWVKAGGPLRAYVETVNVDVTDGKLDITFTPNVENPQINGLEIIPAA